MHQRSITIINKLGLHARAAAKMVKLASKYNTEIQVAKDGKTVNAKSIMGVMMLAATKGSVITFSAQGEEAETALDQIELLIKNRFEEDE